MSSRSVTLEVPIAGGESLAYRAWIPQGTVRHAIVAVHGMMSHSGWFEHLGNALVEHELALFASDRRGSGLSKSLPGLTEVDVWIEDFWRLVEISRKHAPRVSAFGWCGGARTVLAAFERPGELDKLILGAPALAMSVHFQTRLREIVQRSEDVLPLPFDPLDDFSDVPEVREFIASDPLRWRDTPRAYLAPVREALDRSLRAVPELSIPTLCLLADRDRLVDNEATAELFRGHLVEPMPCCHALVLERPAEIATRFVEFLERN